jgi:hypothetical protein
MDQALNQNAVAELVPPSDEIFSIHPDNRSLAANLRRLHTGP